MHDYSWKTVWRRFGNHGDEQIGKMRFGSCAGEVTFPPSSGSVLRTNRDVSLYERTLFRGDCKRNLSHGKSLMWTATQVNK